MSQIEAPVKQSTKDKYFKRYSEPAPTGWKGWIEINEMCVAFVGTDDKIVWMDDLGIDPSESAVPPAAPFDRERLGCCEYMTN